MCDCESGMILDMIIYSGRDTDVEIDQHLGLSGSVVKKLMTDYLGKEQCTRTIFILVPPYSFSFFI